MSSNFSFLEEKWAILAQLGEMAERNVYIDPQTSLIKLRLFGETITKYMFALEEMIDSRELSQHDRLNQLKQQELLPQEVLEILHTIRMTGNRASHEAGYCTTEDAKTQLRLAFKLSLWFMEVYGDWSFQPPVYQEPVQEQEHFQQGFSMHKVLRQMYCSLLANVLTKIAQNKYGYTTYVRTCLALVSAIH